MRVRVYQKTAGFPTDFAVEALRIPHEYKHTGVVKKHPSMSLRIGRYLKQVIEPF